MTLLRERQKRTKGTDQELGRSFAGPVLFYYVWWILAQARTRGLRRIYFLARDGYLLRQIAELFCQRFDLNVQCSYLYCSRASLRLAAYDLLGPEGWDLLLFSGSSSTLASVWRRLWLTDQERRSIREALALKEGEENIPLGRKDFEAAMVKLRSSRAFQEILREKSQRALAAALGYFRQEGLLDQSQIALADSGWVGSMQRSLRQLLESAGYRGGLTGFYFGLFKKPSSQDGEYLTWYFSGKGALLDKVLFNNNLLECILSAPHGTTRGYQEWRGRFEPLIGPPPGPDQKVLIKRQVQLVLDYCRCRLKRTSFESFDPASARKETRQRIRRYMVRPTPAEVQYYGNFLFDGDLSDQERAPLASEAQLSRLSDYSLTKRILRRLSCGEGAPSPSGAGLLWPWGTMAFLPPRKRLWFRWNFFLGEVLRLGLL